MDSKFTGTDRTGPNYQIGPDCAGRVYLQYCNVKRNTDVGVIVAVTVHRVIFAYAG